MENKEKEYEYQAWVRAQGGRSLAAVFASTEGNVTTVNQRIVQDVVLGYSENAPRFLTREMAETALMELAGATPSQS